jgi:hypothetical protein
MANFTQADLLKGIEFNFSNTNQQSCLFDGCGTVFRGQHLLMPYLEKELSLLPYKFVEISSVCNLSVSISNAPERYMKFATNDVRLYNPFMLFARKKMISVYPDGFWAPMYKCKHITISIPEFKSFNYLAYVAESLVEFFKLAMKLKKDFEYTPASRCKVNGCGADPMYYPSICPNHLYYLNKITLNAFLIDKNAKLSYSASQNHIADILSVLVDGYTRHGYSIGTDECIVCGYKTKNTYYGFCNYCLGMIDLITMEADFNNGILTNKDVIDGIWKDYFIGTDKDLITYIKNAQIRKQQQESEEIRIRASTSKSSDGYYKDYMTFASGTAGNAVRV